MILNLLFYWILHKDIGFTSKVVISISFEKNLPDFEGVDNSPPGFCPMRQWEQHDIAKITLPYAVNSQGSWHLTLNQLFDTSRWRLGLFGIFHWQCTVNRPCTTSEEIRFWSVYSQQTLVENIPHHYNLKIHLGRQVFRFWREHQIFYFVLRTYSRVQFNLSTDKTTDIHFIMSRTLTFFQELFSFRNIGPCKRLVVLW